MTKYLLKVGVAPYGLGASDAEDDDDDEDIGSRDTCHPDHCRIPSPALASLGPGHMPPADLSICKQQQGLSKTFCKL